MPTYTVTVPVAQQGRLRTNTVRVTADTPEAARIQAARELGVPAASLSISEAQGDGAGVATTAQANPEGLQRFAHAPFFVTEGNTPSAAARGAIQEGTDGFSTAAPTGEFSRTVTVPGDDSAQLDQQPGSSFQSQFNGAGEGDVFTVTYTDASGQQQVRQWTKAEIQRFAGLGAAVTVVDPTSPGGNFTLGSSGGGGSSGGSGSGGSSSGVTTPSATAPATGSGANIPSEGVGQVIPDGLPGSDIGLDIQDNPFATFQNAIARQGFNPTGVLGGTFNDIFSRVNPALEVGTLTGIIPEVGEAPGALEGAFGQLLPSSSNIALDTFTNLMANRNDIVGRGGPGAQFLAPDFGSAQGQEAAAAFRNLARAAAQNRFGGFTSRFLPSNSALQNRFDRARVAGGGANVPDYASFTAQMLGF